MKDRDGLKKVLLVHHVEGQCRCIIGFKDGDMRAAYMCGEPVYQKRRQEDLFVVCRSLPEDAHRS
ncbi:hypothetical protein ACVIHC_007234 [Bradyrhizobium diazoefficiens]